MPAAPDFVSSTPGWFVAVLAVIVVLTVAGVVGAVYRADRMARRGQNPFTVREDLAYRASRAGVLSPARSKAERLSELDRLVAEGTVSPAERDAARARILAE